MRDISGILSSPADGKRMDFRLTKLPGEGVSAEALLSCLPDSDLFS